MDHVQHPPSRRFHPIIFEALSQISHALQILYLGISWNRVPLKTQDSHGVSWFVIICFLSSLPFWSTLGGMPISRHTQLSHCELIYYSYLYHTMHDGLVAIHRMSRRFYGCFEAAPSFSPLSVGLRSWRRRRMWNALDSPRSALALRRSVWDFWRVSNWWFPDWESIEKHGGVP